MKRPVLHSLRGVVAWTLCISSVACLDGKSPTPPPRVPKPKVGLEAAAPPARPQRPASPMLRATTSFMISLVPP